MASSIIARDDTLLGACYAIGEDFGFNPLYLRILFAFGILWSPAIAFSAYAALTALTTLTRWMAPDPLPAEPEEPAAPAPAERPYAAWLDELPIAA
jgi:phage shock protein PspC (stress-responsive transcriptional regulator)